MDFFESEDWKQITEMDSISTLEDAKFRLAYIEKQAKADSWGSATENEQDLFKGVLIAIANGVNNPEELAREACKSLNIDFQRYSV